MLTVNNVVKSYREGGLFSKKRRLILNNVSFFLNKGECLGIIGESGSGKSSLSRLVLGIEKPDSGQVLFNNENVFTAKMRRGKISAVFQDYTSSFNPMYTVFEVLVEPLLAQKLNRRELEDRALQLLEQVGLNKSFISRYPHELSGGEAQRLCIARAIATKPELLLLDEAISSIDVSAQTRILDLLCGIKEELNLSYIFITHDIQAVTYICGRVLFFHNGRIVEEAQADELYDVRNEYAKELLSSVIFI